MMAFYEAAQPILEDLEKWKRNWALFQEFEVLSSPVLTVNSTLCGFTRVILFYAFHLPEKGCRSKSLQ